MLPRRDTSPGSVNRIAASNSTLHAHVYLPRAWSYLRLNQETRDYRRAYRSLSLSFAVVFAAI
jgi:hypothetical protein